MKKILTVISVIALMIVVPAGSALAANPHYINGPNFSLSGTTVTATGSVAGLGNQNVDVELAVTASVEVNCRNKGGNIAPGQRKFFQDSAMQSDLEVKNGRLNFSISVTPNIPGDLSGTCPNPSWTPLPGDVTIHDATLTIYQPAGSGIVVLQDSASF